MPDETTRRLAAQFAVDRVQIDNRRVLGDDLARPRAVEHFAFFPTRDAALSAADALERCGYRGSLLSKNGRHSVCAVRADAVDEETARRFVREVVGIVVANGGEYDGWGAEVVIARRPVWSIPDSPDEIDWH